MNTDNLNVCDLKIVSLMEFDDSVLVTAHMTHTHYNFYKSSG